MTPTLRVRAMEPLPEAAEPGVTFVAAPLLNVMLEGVPKLKTVATVALAEILPVIWAWAATGAMTRAAANVRRAMRFIGLLEWEEIVRSCVGLTSCAGNVASSYHSD